MSGRRPGSTSGEGAIETAPRDYRSDAITKPPVSTARRDDRAEPDDDGGSARIDIVNIDGGSRDTATSAVVSLRRELARLHQQAAAVERSLDDQRRDRGDALDKLERANDRIVDLEATVAKLEAEAQSLRRMHEDARSDLQRVCLERDDLARAIEAAKAASSDVAKTREDNEKLRADLERAERELTEAKRDATKAREAAAKVRDEADRDRAAAREQNERLERELAATGKAGERVVEIEEELASARSELEGARGELAPLRAELETARGELETARGELETARGATAAAEERAGELAKAVSDLEGRLAEANAGSAELERRSTELASRADAAEKQSREATARADAAEKRAREAEARESSAVSRVTIAESRVAAAESDAAAAEAAALDAKKATVAAAARAEAAESAYAALEQSVRRIRDEIATAFERAAGPSGSAAREAPAPELEVRDAISIAPELVQSLPPSAPPPRSLDDEWGSVAASESLAPSSPISRSVPPPASVPPSRRSRRAPPPLPAPASASDAPPSGAAAEPAPAPSAPPSASPSASPPASRAASEPPPDEAAAERVESAPPPTRRPSSFAPDAAPAPRGSSPPGPSRDELFERLGDPAQAADAARQLRARAEWLHSLPPHTLLTALGAVDYDAEGPVFELARAWDREPLCHALVAQLRSEKDGRLREHEAWLLKHLAAPASWKAIADLARSEDEAVPVRRWLLEALDRLAAGRSIGWRELGDTVTDLASHADSVIRDGVVGILMALERSDDKRRILLEMLRRDDDEVVLASAVHALASVLPVELDPAVIERLLGHPSARVQRSVRDLVERAKREARH